MGSSRSKPVTLVPLLNALVNEATGDQFVEAASHLNSGTTLQPLVPVEVTMIF